MELEHLNRYPNFKDIVELVVNKSHLQKSKILNFHKRVDKTYFEKAENFSQNFKNFLKSQNTNLETATKAYLKMCADMMISHLYFYKHNKYPLDQQQDAFEKVYDNVEEMKSYVYGIAISQFLWPTHYAMYSFFINEINSKLYHLTGEKQSIIETKNPHDNRIKVYKTNINNFKPKTSFIKFLFKF